MPADQRVVQRTPWFFFFNGLRAELVVVLGASMRPILLEEQERAAPACGVQSAARPEPDRAGVPCTIWRLRVCQPSVSREYLEPPVRSSTGRFRRRQGRSGALPARVGRLRSNALCRRFRPFRETKSANRRTLAPSALAPLKISRFPSKSGRFPATFRRCVATDLLTHRQPPNAVIFHHFTLPERLTFWTRPNDRHDSAKLFAALCGRLYFSRRPGSLASR